jgi:uncharacterized protein YhhL (DUF1145 family)
MHIQVKIWLTRQLLGVIWLVVMVAAIHPLWLPLYRFITGQ